MKTYFPKIIIGFFGFSLLVLACGETNTTDQEAVPKEVTQVKETAKINSLGKRLYILCEACHSLKKGDPHKVGPNLHGIFGAKAGVKKGFKYSEAMKASEIIWDEENMKLWLENPIDFIPGANMAFVGIHKEEQMNALIEFLKQETK